MPDIRLIRPLLLFLSIVFFCAVDASFAASTGKKGKLSPQAITYYRAVHVLASLSPHTAAENETIPRKVRLDDATESLLSHNDAILVLRLVADDLKSVRYVFPKARLYESYARLALGNYVNGAELLAGYVAEAPYQARQYAVLCDALKKNGDFITLYIICREWAEKDPSCNPRRNDFTRDALFALGRFDHAVTFSREQALCDHPRELFPKSF